MIFLLMHPSSTHTHTHTQLNENASILYPLPILHPLPPFGLEVLRLGRRRNDRLENHLPVTDAGHTGPLQKVPETCMIIL